MQCLVKCLTIATTFDEKRCWCYLKACIGILGSRQQDLFLVCVEYDLTTSLLLSLLNESCPTNQHESFQDASFSLICILGKFPIGHPKYKLLQTKHAYL